MVYPSSHRNGPRRPARPPPSRGALVGRCGGSGCLAASAVVSARPVCMEHASSSDDRPLPPPRPGCRQLAAAAPGLLISLDLLCGAGGPGEDQPQLRLRHRPESVQPAVRGRRWLRRRCCRLVTGCAETGCPGGRRLRIPLAGPWSPLGRSRTPCSGSIDPAATTQWQRRRHHHRRITITCQCERCDSGEGGCSWCSRQQVALWRRQGVRLQRRGGGEAVQQTVGWSRRRPHCAGATGAGVVRC